MAITNTTRRLGERKEFFQNLKDANLESSLDACHRIYRLRFGRHSYQCDTFSPVRNVCSRQGRKSCDSWRQAESTPVRKVEKSCQQVLLSVASGYFVDDMNCRSMGLSRLHNTQIQDSRSTSEEDNASFYAPSEVLRERWREKHDSFFKKFHARHKGIPQCLQKPQLEHVDNKHAVSGQNFAGYSTMKYKTWIRGADKQAQTRCVPEKKQESHGYHFRQVTRNNKRRPLVDLHHGSTGTAYFSLPVMNCHAISMTDRSKDLSRSASVGGFRSYRNDFSPSECGAILNERRGRCSTSQEARPTVRFTSYTERKSSGDGKIPGFLDPEARNESTWSWCDPDSFDRLNTPEYLDCPKSPRTSITIVVPSASVSDDEKDGLPF